VPHDHPIESRAEPVISALTERQWRALDGLVAVVACVTAYASVGFHPPSTASPKHFVALLAAAPIAFRRRFPITAFALVTIAVAVVMARGQLFLPFSLILGLASYTLATGAPRRRSVEAGLAASALFGASLAFAAHHYWTHSVAGEALEGFIPLVVAWVIGDSIAARRHYLAGLAEQAEREREAKAERAKQQVRAERVRFARELHDVIAHSLAVITVQAGVGLRLMSKRPEEGINALKSIETIGRSAQDELRVVLDLLRDGEVSSAALAPAPVLADLKELAETVRAAGTPVHLTIAGGDGQLSPVLELTVFRIVQEALTNVVKHAPGAEATVKLSVSDKDVTIAVTDDGGGERRGSGDASPTGRKGGGQGIAGMLERVGAFGGSLTAQPTGTGFRVLARIPLQDHL
jgi:signal transduction histidine kinase